MSKAEVIAEVANHEYSRGAVALLDDGSGKATKRKRMTSHELPAGYQSFSFEQLQALCASYGFVPKANSKADLLEAIEAEIFDYEEELDKRRPSEARLSLEGQKGPLMLMGDEEDHFVPNKKPSISTDMLKKKKIVVVDDDDEDYLGDSD
jgi:hypothetical protein